MKPALLALCRGSHPSAIGAFMQDKSVLINRDRMNSANQDEVANGCVSLFDRIQHLPKHIQLLSLAAAFILSASASGIPAQDAFSAVKNLMYDPLTSTGIAPQFQAMEYHLRTEVLRDR